MSQETRVLATAPMLAANLRQELDASLAGDSQWRPVPHAVFSVKADGVVATLYQSGKLVLQGTGIEDWLVRHLPSLAGSGQSKANEPELAFDRPIIGSDEVGKGDYFGPLVVVAAYADPIASAPWMRQIGVADSKTLGDQRILIVAGQLESRIDHEIALLDPEPYNERYAKVRNVNVLLAQLHAQAIAALLKRHPGTAVLVDQFSRAGLVEAELAKLGLGAASVRQSVRAERHPVVAAASILARAAFLDGIARCSDAAATDLHKGAGASVDVAARRVMAIGGLPLLSKVAKLHFKNTAKIEPR